MSFTFEDFLGFLPYIITFLLALINFVTRGRYKKIQSEVEKLIEYRNADYRMNSEEKPKGTSFSNLIPQFRLNKATGELELGDPLDITALVNSSRDCELKELLSRLESGTAELTQQVRTQYEDYSDDLDELAQALDVAEDYRERFGMSEDVSVSEIFARIETERDKLKKDLDVIENAQQAVPPQTPTESEVKDNAQEIVEKKES